MSVAVEGSIKLISGNSHPDFAHLIAAHLGINLAKVIALKQTNGESTITFGESVRDEDVYIIQTGSGNINDYIMELLIIVSGCKAASARRITVGMYALIYIKNTLLHSYSVFCIC